MGVLDAANALDQAKLTKSAVNAMTADAPPADPSSRSAGQVPGEAPQSDTDAKSTSDTDAKTPSNVFDSLDVPANIKPGLDAIGASLAQAGVSDFAIHHVADWLLAMKEAHDAREDIGNVLPRHKYHVEHRFALEQQPFVNWFLNSMNAAGASQSDVDGILSWYKSNEPKFAQASVAAYRQVEALDMQDRSRAQKALTAEWGREYANNIKLINRFLDSLPAARRAAIEAEVLPDGRRGLNDLERLRKLAQLARGGSESRAEIEKLMGDRYSKYWKGPDADRLQARYRDLLRET